MLLLGTGARSEETLLQCKFTWGEKAIRGNIIKSEYISDKFLKIDFKNEKVFDGPYNVYGTFGNETKTIFSVSEVMWVGKNKYVALSATLNRQTGQLREIRNYLDKERESEEINYICSKTKLKF
jgi:hypothetical protein